MLPSSVNSCISPHGIPFACVLAFERPLFCRHRPFPISAVHSVAIVHNTSSCQIQIWACCCGLWFCSPGYDFAQAPMLVTSCKGKTCKTRVVAGQKSGWLWSLIPETGDVDWALQVGPGGWRCCYHCCATALIDTKMNRPPVSLHKGQYLFISHLPVNQLSVAFVLVSPALYDQHVNNGNQRAEKTQTGVEPPDHCCPWCCSIPCLPHMHCTCVPLCHVSHCDPCVAKCGRCHCERVELLKQP